MASYLVYICQAVKNRAGLERYWQVAPAVYPENIDVLVGYGLPLLNLGRVLGVLRFPDNRLDESGSD
jgi:hypothetical protein